MTGLAYTIERICSEGKGLAHGEGVLRFVLSKSIGLVFVESQVLQGYEEYVQV